MPSMTVTITDHTATAASLAQLAFNDTVPTGYTRVKSDVQGHIGDNSTGPTMVDYLSVQASYGNGGAHIYVGGSNVKNDGTCQARDMFAGDVKEYQKGSYPTIVLSQIFVRSDTDNAVFNVEWQ